MKNNIKMHFLMSGIFILLFIVVNIFLSTTLFIFKISITKYNMIIALALSMLIMLFLLKRHKINIKCIKTILIVFIIPILMIILSLFVNGKIRDFTFDGNTYHKATIGLLKEGWNPLYETSSEFDNSRKEKIYIENSSSELWTDTYARASHIFQANAYALTGNIESGKSINTLSILALFIVVLSYLSLRLNKVLFPLFFSICVISSAINCAQYLTMYIDFFVYIFLVFLILSFFIIEFSKTKEEKNIGLYIYILSLLMMINIKFNSFAYAGLYCLAFYVYYIIKLKKGKLEKKFFIEFTCLSALTVIIGVFVIGLSVYPKNFVQNGNPFYPLYGENKVDIITNNQPEEFEGKGTLEKYFISMFSQAANMSKSSHEKTKYKIPFTFTYEELKAVKASDTRISGNGVMFSGIFVLSLLLVLLLSKKVYKNNKKLFIICSITLGVSLFILLILSESWWARYFPQTYFLVLVSILYLYVLHNKKTNVILGIFIILVLINNFITFGCATGYSYLNNKSASEEVSLVKYNTDIDNDTILIKSPLFIGAIYNIYRDLDGYNVIVLPRDSEEELTNPLMNGLINWKVVKNERLY